MLMRIKQMGYRRYNLFKCELDKCCNFTISYTSERRKYCKQHRKGPRLMVEFKK